MSLQADDAVVQSPNRAPPPLALSRDSSSASKSTPTVIDLSSPTTPPKRQQCEGRRSEIVASHPTKRRVGEDEKRLIGDYDIPADAVHVPDPSTWMNEPRKMHTKPGLNKGYKPIDTLTKVPPIAGPKPTTYGKHTRPRPLPPLIGQGQGPGQAAYSHLQRSKAPTTPACRAPSRGEQDPWTGETPSTKRRKTEHVINLEADDDEVLEVSRPVISMPEGTPYEKPLSARSSQSRLSIGSGSTVADFKPSQPMSEFRAVDDLLKHPQKKPRRQSSSRRQGPRPGSPLASGSMSSTAHQFVLRDFRQGEDSHSPKQREQREQHVRSEHPVTSKLFPDARINESTTEQARHHRSSTGNTAHLRTQQRPVPKRADQVEDSDSADELAFSPFTKQKVSPSKANKVASSGVKQTERDKDRSVAWPLSFARSYIYEGHISNAKDGCDSLVLRCESEGLRVQKLDKEGYKTEMIIPAQHVNRVFADNTSRIRLHGPRDADGGIPVFDLQFFNSSDFLTFRDTHAANLTSRGRVIIKDDEHMQRLFTTPLRPKNNKIGTSELVNDAIEDPDDHRTNNHKPKTPLWDQMKRQSKGDEEGPAPKAKTTTAALARPARSSRAAPTYVADSPKMAKVPKYSVDVGLGRRWTKSLEYGEGRQRAIVHFDDLPRLDEEEYLNDSLIDFYMIYLHKQLQVPHNKVYFFNTYFFTRLTENAGRKSMDYKAVERWTSRVDIFAYDYIVVPINESQSHWYLAIICNVSNLKRKPILQDFDEQHAPTQERSDSTAQPVTSSDNDEERITQEVSNPKPPVTTGCSQSQEEEDPNLFDEESLSLIDRNDTRMEVGSNTKMDEAKDLCPLTKAGPGNAPQSTTGAKIISQDVFAQETMMFAKNKAKRKPTPKRDPNQPVIVVLDSLGGSARSGVVRALKDWVAAEGDKRRGMEAIIKENGYYPKNTQIPMQDNWSDCGVYLLGYVEKFFQNPDGFMQRLLTGSMSAKEDWPELKPSEMRHKIRKIIFQCHDQQEEARKVQKKAKKESASSDKSSTSHVAQKAADPNPLASLTRRASPEKPPTPKTQNKSEKRLAIEESPARTCSSMPLPQPRLGSPFKPHNGDATLIKHSSRELTVKVSDSPPIVRSPAKKASVTPRSDEKPRQHSPEVRVPGRTPQPHQSTSNGLKKTIGSPRKDEPTHRHGDASRSPSLNKRRRQDDGNALIGSPKAKRQSVKSSRQQKADDDSESKASFPNSGKGSAANMPIEIEDSQEMQVVDSAQDGCHLQPGFFAHCRPSSSEEVLGRSPQDKSGDYRLTRRSIGRQLEAKLDEDDDARRAREVSASAAKHSSPRTNEVARDPMDAISQSTDRMQLDVADDGSVVRETPEPDRRSPTARNARF